MYLGLLLDLLLRPKEWLPCTTIECTPTHARSALVSISLSSLSLSLASTTIVAVEKCLVLGRWCTLAVGL